MFIYKALSTEVDQPKLEVTYSRKNREQDVK